MGGPGLMLMLMLAVLTGHTQEPAPSESRIKAAFLFNFAKFVEWPPEAFAEKTSPFVIGVLGANTIVGDLEQMIRGKTVGERPLQVKEFHSPTEITNCHILFISTSAKQPLPEIFTRLGGASVLTVGEKERFTQAGGMINFIIEEKKTRFEINDDAAKKAGLKISAKLLNLALRPKS